MNSSVNPPSKSTHSSNSEVPGESVTDGHVETAADDSVRQLPIPPPSEAMQYRAIGLVRGRYCASAEQFTQGTLVAPDGTEIDSVLLGRIISLLRNHLDLNQEHLWVVYPRMGQQNPNLHLQIVGVWEPERLSRVPATVRPTPQPEAVVEDGYFSVRGEIVYQSAVDRQFVVKIKQAARQESDKPKYFKLKIQGVLATKAVGQFWNLQARRQDHELVLEKGEAITVVPSKPKLRKNKPSSGEYSGAKRNFDPPRPVRKADDRSIARPVPKTPNPKPIKRQKPPQ